MVLKISASKDQSRKKNIIEQKNAPLSGIMELAIMAQDASSLTMRPL
jgi:hypothetical protein